MIDATMAYGPGMTMSQHVELTVEEESYFPRSARIIKTVMQPDSPPSNTHRLEMYSNVAVVRSKLNTAEGSRSAVVPTGVAITDLGCARVSLPDAVLVRPCFRGRTALPVLRSLR